MASMYAGFGFLVDLGVFPPTFEFCASFGALATGLFTSGVISSESGPETLAGSSFVLEFDGGLGLRPLVGISASGVSCLT